MLNKSKGREMDFISFFWVGKSFSEENEYNGCKSIALVDTHPSHEILHKANYEKGFNQVVPMMQFRVDKPHSLHTSTPQFVV